MNEYEEIKKSLNKISDNSIIIILCLIGILILMGFSNYILKIEIDELKVQVEQVQVEQVQGYKGE